MPLTLAITPQTPWRSLTPLLQHLGWQHTTQPGDIGHQHLPAQTADPNTGPYLLLHTRPELAIAHLLGEGHTPEQALAQWQSAAEQLLSFYKYNRTQAALVEATSAAQHPTGLLSWLKQHHPAFGEHTQNPAPENLNNTEQPPEPDSLNLLIATQLVAQTPGLESLLAQLEASSIPLGEDHYAQPSVDVLSIHEAVNQQQETQAQNASQESQSLKEESSLLLEQLHKVQEELENYYLKAKGDESRSRELQEENNTLKADLQNLKSQVAQAQTERDQALKAQQTDAADKQKLETQNQDIKEENDLILKQLFKVQEELETYYLDLKAEKDKHEKTKQVSKADKARIKQAWRKARDQGQALTNAKLEIALAIAEKNTLQNRLQCVEQSLSWRITKPLRKVVRALDPTAKQQRTLQTQVALVKESEYFDAKWYLSQYPDVAAEGADPAEHYVIFGTEEGRQPGPNFDANAYLKKHPDVAKAGENPLIHYLLHGRVEGRSLK